MEEFSMYEKERKNSSTELKKVSGTNDMKNDGKRHLGYHDLNKLLKLQKFPSQPVGYESSQKKKTRNQKSK